MHGTVGSPARDLPAGEYHPLVADVDGKPLAERLEEIGAQLAWVRDYL
jgi:hypothetical protein